MAGGNYVVASPSWDNGALLDAGAVTFGSGTAGVAGAVSPANSLVGTTAVDMVGSGGVAALASGNYVVTSPNWDNGAVDVVIPDDGAIAYTDAEVGRLFDELKELDLFDRAGMDTDVHPCTTEEFPRPAPRPRNSVLASERGAPHLPAWQEGLDAFLGVRR